MNKPRTSLLSVTLVSAAVVLAASGGAVAGTVITGAQIKDGTVTSADVKNGSLSQGDLTAGTVRSLRTVRAWAAVDADGTITASSPGVSLTKSTSFAGTYCLAAPGVDGRRTAAVATLDFQSSGTVLATGTPQAFVEVGNYQNACSATRVVVNTMIRFYETDGSTSLQRSDQPFQVVIP